MPTSLKPSETKNPTKVKAPGKNVSWWTVCLLLTNLLLLVAVGVLLWRQSNQNQGSEINPNDIVSLVSNGNIANAQPTNAANLTPTAIGKRRQLSYEKWLEILKQEASVAESNRPSNLAVIAGDSLSLWFPSDLLPEGMNWLNQGISGETSGGLLKRLNFFSRTQPKRIWVMIGINDLIRAKSDREIIDNYQKIITNLVKTHPKTKIIIQSILPHAGEAISWEGREKLLAIPNSRIRQLNSQIQDLATKNKASFLNLYPLFSDSQGNLKPEFSTDGLHLSREGYLTWRSAMILFGRELGSGGVGE